MRRCRDDGGGDADGDDVDFNNVGDDNVVGGDDQHDGYGVGALARSVCSLSLDLLRLSLRWCFSILSICSFSCLHFVDSQVSET